MAKSENLVPVMLPQNRPLDYDKYDVLRDKINELIETIELLQQRISELENTNEG